MAGRRRGCMEGGVTGEEGTTKWRGGMKGVRSRRTNGHDGWECFFIGWPLIGACNMMFTLTEQLHLYRTTLCVRTKPQQYSTADWTDRPVLQTHSLTLLILLLFFSRYSLVKKRSLVEPFSHRNASCSPYLQTHCNAIMSRTVLCTYEFVNYNSSGGAAVCWYAHM